MSNNAPAKKASASVLFGAAFLMATSAIGPGFLTQTSKFTAQYGAPLIMVVLCAIIMDITAQMNIWSIIGVSGMRAQDIANKMLPGLGVFLAIIVSIGGLAYATLLTLYLVPVLYDLFNRKEMKEIKVDFEDED